MTDWGRTADREVQEFEYLKTNRTSSAKLLLLFLQLLSAFLVKYIKIAGTSKESYPDVSLGNCQIFSSFPEEHSISNCFLNIARTCKVFLKFSQLLKQFVYNSITVSLHCNYTAILILGSFSLELLSHIGRYFLVLNTIFIKTKKVPFLREVLLGSKCYSLFTGLFYSNLYIFETSLSTRKNLAAQLLI